MAWDLNIDLQSGDLTFNSIRDLGFTQAESLIQQRIHTRLMVERGGFIYDDTGLLGSRLKSLFDIGVPKSIANIEMLIREALAPMTDIQVTNVDIFSFNDGSEQVSDPTVAKARISYQLISSVNPDLSPVSPNPSVAEVAIPG